MNDFPTQPCGGQKGGYIEWGGASSTIIAPSLHIQRWRTALHRERARRNSICNGFGPTC